MADDGVPPSLTDRQSFIEALLETVEVGIVSCDADGVFVVSNRAERTMFGLQTAIAGLAADDLESRIDVFDAAGRWIAPHEYPLMRALRGEDVSRMEVIAGPSGGPYRDIVVRARQITNSRGEVLGAVAALADVTAERRAVRELSDEHRRLVAAQRIGNLGSFEYDFASGRWTVSENLGRIWGVDRHAVTSDLVHSLIAEEDRPVAREAWATACRDGRASCEYRIRRPSDGAERHIRSNLEIDVAQDGTPVRGRGTHLDVTDLVGAEAAARRATAFLDAVLTASPDYTFVSDAETGAVIYGSRGKELLGLHSEDLERLGPFGIATLLEPDGRQQVRSANETARTLDDGQVHQLQCRGRHADGSERWLSLRVTPFRRDADGRVVEVLTVARDVTDGVEAQQRLVRAARHDTLTGLPNRAVLVERLTQALGRTSNGGREIAILFCDLDGFKSVNDSGGHAAGDAVLVETARRLSSVIREHDTVARVGGDEFVVVVEPRDRTDRRLTAEASEDGERRATDRAIAVDVAERIMRALREPVHVGGKPYVVTASIGITYADGGSVADAATAEDLLHGADSAMYLAKSSGKNRVEILESQAAAAPPR